MPKYTSVRFQRSAKAMVCGSLAPVPAVQHAPEPDQRRALLDRNPVVLRGTHRELAEPVLPGQLAQPAEVRAGRFGTLGERRHRHQAADIVVEMEETRKVFRR